MEKNRGFYMVLSLLIAMALWMYVGNKNPNEEGPVRNLPVTFSGI